MKYATPVALLIGAAPALLVGQVTVDCPEERCQVAPYFAGNGGFVGQSAGYAGERDVTFTLLCGNTTVSSTVQPDSQGIVRQALNQAEGLNCRAGTSGRIEADNMLPGGWYWINDGPNSAVSAFIPKDALGNEQIDVTNPGGVILDSPSGSVATYVKHEPTGRVGIIPHLVPTKPIPGCSGMVTSESAMDCHLGSLEDWQLRASPSSVDRPTGSQPVKEVAITLYGENFVTTGSSVFARGAVEHHTSVEGILFSQTTGESPGQGRPGVVRWLVEIAGDDARCLPANNDPDRGNAQTVTFKLAEMEGAIPDPPNDSVETTFEVNCPDSAASSAGAGAELVPENPFPVDR